MPAPSAMNVWMRGAADDRSGEGTHESRVMNCGGVLRLGVFGSWSVTSSTSRKIVRTVTVIGWATHSDHFAVDVDPAQERTPGDHRRRGQRAQTGDHTDRQSEQDNDDLRHGNLPTGGKDNPDANTQPRG